MPYQTERWLSIAVGAASLAAVLLLWELAGAARWINPTLLPPPSRIFETLAGIVASGKFLGPLWHTFALFATGYAIACALGVGLGVAMGTSPTL